MKKIFIIISLLLVASLSFSQSIVNRTNSSYTVQDSRFSAALNLFVPRYADTTAANLAVGIDSLSAIIYTYDVQSFWGRQYSSGKRWVALGSGGGGGSGTVTNIATGLGLSGGPITTTGTLLVDTASASILSRQRAAATYQPIGDYLVTDSWYNIVRDGGADSTGTTDVSTIIQNAINDGWKTIFIPHGTFLVSTQIEMEDSVTIMGAGRFASRIKLETDITAFHCSFNTGGNNTTFSDIGFYGDYSGGGATTQMGIAIDSAKSILVKSISGYNMGGFVVNVSQNATSSGYIQVAGRSNTITDSYFEANYGGVNFAVRAEYNEISNSTFTGNVYAIQNIGGNNRITSNSVENNTWGLYMTSGTNGGHGLAANNTFNHNGTPGVGANIYMNGITLGFNFTNNTFAQNASATAGVFEIISCADIMWEGGYITNDTVRVTSSTNIMFSNMRKYTTLTPVWVVVSGEAPTVFNVGRVDNSISLFDPTNTKQLDITYLNNKTNFTGTSGNTFGFLNAAADSTVDITGSLRATTGVRFSGLPTAVGVYSVRADANGTLSLADTTIAGASPFLPVTGTGTATGAVTGELAGNVFTITQGGNEILHIDPTPNAEHSHLQATNTTGDGNYASLQMQTSDLQAVFEIALGFNDVNFASIQGSSDASNTLLEYSADTHTFTGNVGIGVGPTVLFQVQSGGNDFLSIDPTAGSETSTLRAFNTTDDDNFSVITAFTANTEASFFLQSNFNSGVKVATIEGLVNASSSHIDYQADIHDFEGNITTTDNNTYDIGDATNSFKDIYGRTLHLDGSTSGEVTFQSDALGNTGTSTTLSGTGYSPSVMFAALSSDFTMSDVNTVQPVFPTGFDVWTLQASTTYMFEGTYILTHNATSHSVGMSFELAGGASVTSISYYTLGHFTAIGTPTASQNTNTINVTTNVAINTAGANAIETIRFWGILRVNAGGTFTPSITFSAAPGGTCLARVGTYIKFTPIGSSTATSLGNVN